MAAKTTALTQFKFRSIELDRDLDSREDVARFILINSKVANNDGWGKYNLSSTGILLNAILSTSDEAHLARIAPSFGIEVTPIPVEQQAIVHSFGFQTSDDVKSTGLTGETTITTTNESPEAKAAAKAAKPGQFAKKT